MEFLSSYAIIGEKTTSSLECLVSRASKQVWLHLRGFQHLKTPPAPSDLDEVSEIASEHAEELA